MKTKNKYSYADALKEYEEWVIDVAPNVPRIKCKEQQVLMSQYHWETDKIVNSPMTLGDGGDFEEVVALLCHKIFYHGISSSHYL